MSQGRIEEFRSDIIAISHRLHANGWVANHDGNLSARLDGDNLLCTPTAVSKGDIQPSWLIVVDGENKVIQGARRAFSELQLHRAAYGAREDISVVIHAHPPVCCAFAVAGEAIPHPMLAESVVSLGAEIPMVPYSRPGAESLSQDIAAALGKADVIILERHGVLAVGGSFEQAYLRMELLEHLATIAMNARIIGDVRCLPADEVAALSKRGRPKSMPMRAPAPAQMTQNPGDSPQASAPQDVTGLVSAALKRFS